MAKIDVAVVDINVGGEDVSPLCHLLTEQTIRFLFHSGYPSAPDGWGHVPIVPKPAGRQEIVDAVERLYRSCKQAA